MIKFFALLLGEYTGDMRIKEAHISDEAFASFKESVGSGKVNIGNFGEVNIDEQTANMTQADCDEELNAIVEEGGLGMVETFTLESDEPESGQCTFNFTFYNLDEDDDGTQYEEMPCVVEAVYDNGIFTLKTPSAGLLMASETDGEYCITGAGLKVPGAEEDEVVVLFFTLEISANKPK